MVITISDNEKEAALDKVREHLAVHIPNSEKLEKIIKLNAFKDGDILKAILDTKLVEIFKKIVPSGFEDMMEAVGKYVRDDKKIREIADIAIPFREECRASQRSCIIPLYHFIERAVHPGTMTAVIESGIISKLRNLNIYNGSGKDGEPDALDIVVGKDFDSPDHPRPPVIATLKSEQIKAFANMVEFSEVFNKGKTDKEKKITISALCTANTHVWDILAEGLENNKTKKAKLVKTFTKNNEIPFHQRVSKKIGREKIM